MSAPGSDWSALCAHVRRHVDGAFDLAPGLIHLNTMLIASPPHAVQEAIARHQAGFNLDPAGYFFSRVDSDGDVLAVQAANRVARSAALYLGLPADDNTRPGTDYIAQTGSTTMGMALLANGIRARDDQEVIASVHDFPAMREVWEYRRDRTGVEYREIRLYRDPRAPGLRQEILHNVQRAARKRTRVLALTWVHSSTGVKLPIRRISAMVRAWNAERKPRDRVLFCVDGVHGFGVENRSFGELGCDYFVAGCHKWLFGPRGTGIVCAYPEGWREVSPTIPSFLPMVGAGAANTPGGVQTYEYVWAVADAFEYHLTIGKAAVERYTHALADRLKRGLATLRGVDVVTPMLQALSGGVVCCDLYGVPPREAVRMLRDRGVIAMASTADADGNTHLRFSPSILNTPAQIDRAVSEVAAIATRS